MVTRGGSDFSAPRLRFQLVATRREQVDGPPRAPLRNKALRVPDRHLNQRLLSLHNCHLSFSSESSLLFSAPSFTLNLPSSMTKLPPETPRAPSWEGCRDTKLCGEKGFQHADQRRMVIFENLATDSDILSIQTKVMFDGLQR